MKRFLLFIFLFSLLSCQHNKKQETKTNENTDIDLQKEGIDEDFTVYKFDGFEKFLHQKDGKIHVINFWATFCPPCIKEMPYFEKLNKETEVDVLLVSLDMGMMMDEDLKPFLKKHPIESKLIVLDDPESQQWIPKVAPSWKSSLPATLIYKNDKSKFFEKPFRSYDELISEIDKFN